jgi:hypothetical protein
VTFSAKLLPVVCAAIADHLGRLMLPLDQPPRVTLAPDLDCDGLSMRGEILLNPRMLEATPEFLSLTLAHEVAHQWWGAEGGRRALPNEGMAELMALDWLEWIHGPRAEADAARIARGKMFHGFLGMGTDLGEAEVLGRQVLVLRDARRIFKGEFWRFARDVHAGGSRGACSDSHEWQTTLIATLRHPCVLPVPGVSDGRVTDLDGTGLFAAVDLTGPCGKQSVAAIAATCGLGDGLADTQTGAVFDGSHESDITRYLEAVSN